MNHVSAEALITESSQAKYWLSN